MSNVNTLCESQVECPNIPAEYFNQETTIVEMESAADETELLIALTSFFAGYTVLFIAFLIFTLCRNKDTNSTYKKPFRLIIITITILIETFDVLTDIAQTNNVINGVDCGVTSCIKKDATIGWLMIPCIAIGTIGTVISLYTFCKTTAFNMYDDDTDRRKYDKLNRVSDFMKIWGENIPMLLLMVYWVFAGDGALKKFSFFSTTFIISLVIMAFNFYWQVIPLICCCCCKNSDEYQENVQNQQQMQLGVATQPIQPSAQVVTAPIFVQQQPMVVTTVQQPLQPTAESLPPGWRMVTDANGRIYYQNDMTQTTQWEKPEISGMPQYAPTNPSYSAPKPMQQPQHIQQQFSNTSTNNDNTATVFDSPENYYKKDNDDLSCCGKACIWCGCVIFSWFFWALIVFVQLFVVLDSVSLNQDMWRVMSTDESCITADNFYWELDTLYSNATNMEYPLWLKLETSMKPIMETDRLSYFGNEPNQDSDYPCFYTAIPQGTGQCVKWIFDCEFPYYVTYTTDKLCFDFCGS